MEINDKEFFFGRAYDLQSKQADPEKPVFYDPADLTTHGVITGMTGSGKTGMGIVLLEEAALQGIAPVRRAELRFRGASFAGETIELSVQQRM